MLILTTTGRIFSCVLFFIVIVRSANSLTPINEITTHQIKTIPSEGVVPLKIYFVPYKSQESATISYNDVTKYSWNFGDSSFSSQPRPTHIYYQPGLYTITLTLYYQNGRVETNSTSIRVKQDDTKTEIFSTPTTAALEQVVYKRQETATSNALNSTNDPSDDTTTTTTSPPTDSESQSSPKTTIIIMVFVIGCTVVPIVSIIGLLIWRKRATFWGEQGAVYTSGGSNNERGGSSTLLPMPTSPLICYKADEIDVLNSIGEGNYGKVYRGLLHGSTEVALKHLKNTTHSDEFEHEIAMLQTLSHPNIVRFIGMYTSKEGIQCMVTEFVPGGNLCALLHEKKNLISLQDLIGLAKGAAAGMTFLESQRIIHRDLALRNILVTEQQGKYIVKITDFGLSRLIDTEYYVTTHRNLPVKWCAPEVLQYGRCTSKSDVWSFGIVLWELFSYGMIPYMGLSNPETIQKVLEGNTLDIPPDCPPPIADLMRDCWNMTPDLRPSFKRICETIIRIDEEWDASYTEDNTTVDHGEETEQPTETEEEDNTEHRNEQNSKSGSASDEDESDEDDEDESEQEDDETSESQSPDDRQDFKLDRYSDVKQFMQSRSAQ